MPVGSTDLRYFWPSTVGTIPAGSSRDTDFDSKYLYGVSGDPAGGGGNATHDHDDVAHTHVSPAHNHDLSITGTPTSKIGTAGFPFAQSMSGPIHTHSGEVDSANATATINNTDITIESVAAHPPYTKVIVLAPDDIGQDVPVGAVVLADADISDADWKITDGNNGTVDLDDDFLLGATAAGDGGGGGGAATHTHNSDHQHTTTHTHSDSPFPAEVDAGVRPAKFLGTAWYGNPRGAHHTALNISTETPTLASASADVSSETSEPAYTKLLGLQNKGGSAASLEGIVLAYVGTMANLPIGWKRLDTLMSSQIKVTTAPGEIGDTGGSNTHEHTCTPQDHPGYNHTHTYDFGTASSTDQVAATGTTVSAGSKTWHSHTGGHDMEIDAIHTNDTTVTFSDGAIDGRLPYKNVTWVKLVSLAHTRIRGAVIRGANIAAA